MNKGTIIGISVGVVAVIVIIFMFMGGGAWPQDKQDEYMDMCMLMSNQEFCDCTLDHLMDNYESYNAMMGDDMGFSAGFDAGEACSDKMFNY